MIKKKIIVTRDTIRHWITENVFLLGIQEFLLNENILDL